MLTFNIYTGVVQRRRQSWTAFPLFVLWWVLCFVSFAAVIFTDCIELDYSGFSPEVLKISGAPTTPSQLVQSLNPATAQAILDRAARVANRNRGAAPTALFTNTTTTPSHPTPATVSTPAHSGATAYTVTYIYCM